jgi:hypothetical protein
MFDNFFSENPPIYEIMWKTMVELERGKTICQMRAACWVRKVKCAKTHVCAFTPTPKCTHALTRTPSHTHTHTHTHINKKFALEQTLKPQTWSRGTALLFL